MSPVLPVHETSSIHIPKTTKVFQQELVSTDEDFNHSNRFLADALFLRTSCSLCRQYFPCLRVSLKKVDSITFVSASASWAPEWTQCSWIPSAKISLMARACNCVRNSWQFGAAVRVVRSYKLLQSVIARSFSVILIVGMEMASGRFWIVSGFCHWMSGFWIQSRPGKVWSDPTPMRVLRFPLIKCLSLFFGSFLYPKTKD